MCIFIGDLPPFVAATKIMVMWLLARNFQFTVYQNEVEQRGEEVAMILPYFVGPNWESALPAAVVSFESYPKFFRELDLVFPKIPRYPKGYVHTLSADPMPIERVGSYDVSVASTFEKLKQINFGHFKIDENTTEMLRENYGEQYGFVVAKLRKGTDNPHPIGYVHLNEGGKLFTPTRHGGHDESKTDYEKRMVAEFKNEVIDVENSVKHYDWDHQIYVYKRKEVEGEAIPFKRFELDTLAPWRIVLADMKRVQELLPTDYYNPNSSTDNRHKIPSALTTHCSRITVEGDYAWNGDLFF